MEKELRTACRINAAGNLLKKKGIKMNRTENTELSPIDMIQELYPTLSSAQKRIADLMLKELETVCFLRLDEVSAKAGVTSVTVIRFVKKLGYESYGAFKKDLQNYVQTMIAPKRIIKSDIQNLRNEPMAEIVRQAIANEFTLMSDTYKAMPVSTLIEVTELIKNARKIYIAGTGLSLPVAEMLLVRLNFLCLDAQILPHDNLTVLPYQLTNAGPDDVFIVFSFPNYKRFAADVAKCAQNMGSHTVCITDKASSLAAGHADKLLLCQTSSLVYYNSMTMPVSLVTILSTILAVQLNSDSKMKERLKYISSFFKQ